MNKLVAGIGAALVFGCAGAQLPSAKALECRYTLLEPYLGPATEELVTEGLKNPAAVVDALISLGLTPTTVMMLGDAWRACAGNQESAPATPVQAPPPSPGNKVL